MENTDEKHVEKKCDESDSLGTVKSIASGKQRTSLRRLIGWIVAGNPFYPLSAVLVLLGVFLLSGEEEFFGSETRQLVFNMAAVQIYGLLMVATAIYLNQKQIVYDAVLLAALVSLPILVPFVLISQAASLGRNPMIFGSTAAALCAFAQFEWLRWGMPRLRLSGGFRGFFSAAVGLNLTLPLALNEVHGRLDAVKWFFFLETFWPLVWYVVLPALVAFAFVIKPPGASNREGVVAKWVPPIWIVASIAATAAQLGGLSFVYSTPWRFSYLYPALWLLAWLVVFRLKSWVHEIPMVVEHALVALPMFVGVIAWNQPEDISVSWLNLANAIAFGIILAAGQRRLLNWVLFCVSVLSWFRVVPLTAVASWSPNLNRIDLILLLASVATFAAGSWRRKPVWGVLSALAVIHPLQFFWLTSNSEWPVVGQIMLTVWWVHSLRWNFVNGEGRVLRRVAFGMWCVQSLIWIAFNNGSGPVGLAVFAVVFTGSAACRAWLLRYRRDWVYAVVSLCVLGTQFAPNGLAVVREIPLGLLIVVAGLGSFGFGTLIATRRGQWALMPSQQEIDGNNS